MHESREREREKERQAVRKDEKRWRGWLVHWLGMGMKAAAFMTMIRWQSPATHSLAQRERERERCRAKIERRVQNRRASVCERERESS